MGEPSTPRGLLSWAASVADSYHRPFIGKYDRRPRVDWRTSDRKEAAISIIRLLEQSANGNGGAALVYMYFVEDCSWWSFTEAEQEVIRITIRVFSRRLREAGFLDGEKQSISEN